MPAPTARAGGPIAWGEGHLSGSKRCKLPTLENRMKVVDAYVAAFKKTPLLMLIGGGDCLKYACAHGTGWRPDCLGRGAPERIEKVQAAYVGKPHEGGRCLRCRIQEDAAPDADWWRRLPEICLRPRHGL